MNEAVAFLKIYNITETPVLAEINRAEVMRYAGMFKSGMANGVDDEDRANMLSVMEEMIAEVMPKLTYKVSYRHDNIEWDSDRPILPFDIMNSKDICNNLAKCDEVIMFAATIGIEIDRLIAKYNRISPVKALFLQAIGAERIEALCDLFNSEIRNEALGRGKTTSMRFSPGYGDLPLEVQKEFVQLLDVGRRIGVTLNDSLLMSPSKSVTALIGIKDDTEFSCPDIRDNNARKQSKCVDCKKTDCEYRQII